MQTQYKCKHFNYMTRMKKAIFPLAALAIAMASCDTGTKDSYQTIQYPEYNLIIDNQDIDAPAQASYGSYEIKFNYSRNVIDIKSSEIILNNQKYTFESDTMAIRTQTFKTELYGDAFNYVFSKPGSAGVGSSVSNLEG